jgi:hypothetical protein
VISDMTPVDAIVLGVSEDALLRSSDEGVIPSLIRAKLNVCPK